MIRFLHLRKKDPEGAYATHGGYTVAYQVDEMDQVSRWAYARCSDKENFCKATGRTISTGRLASKKQSRTIIPCSEKAFIASVTNTIYKV